MGWCWRLWSDTKPPLTHLLVLLLLLKHAPPLSIPTPHLHRPGAPLLILGQLKFDLLSSAFSEPPQALLYSLFPQVHCLYFCESLSLVPQLLT